MTTPQPELLDCQLAIVDRASAGHSVALFEQMHDIVPQTLENQADLLPCLVPLARQPPDVRNLLQAWQVQHHPALCALLQGEVIAMAPLARFLANRLVWPHRQAQLLLRYYDPRVLAQLQWMLDAGQAELFVPPGYHWHYFDGQHWVVLQNSHAPAMFPMIHAPQWDAIERIGVINQVLQAMPQLYAQGVATASRQTLALLQDGQRALALETPEDLASYAQWGWRLGADFLHHRAMLPLLAQFKAGQLGFADIMSRAVMEAGDEAQFTARFAHRPATH